jgi:U3 small nucleolar RNA-associated protein 14
MGSKHKESKWAKSLKQTGRTAWDEDVRHGAVELAQREEELRQRIEGKRVTRGEDEDYLGSSSESESENENPWEEQDSDSEKRKLLKKLKKLEGAAEADQEAKGPYAKLLSLKFMQNADAARKEENDAEIRRLNRELQGGEESQSEAESEIGRRKFGHSDKKTEKDNSKKQTTRNEFEEAPGSDEEAEHHADQQLETKPSTKKTTPQPNKKPNAKPLARANREVPAQDEPEGEEENPWLVQTTGKNRRSKADDSQQTVDIAPVGPEPTKSSSKKTAAASKAKTSIPLLRDTHAESDSDDEANVPVLLKNHDLVQRAFAGDEVVQAFEQEKLDTVKEEGDQVIDETLPGWGSWTGDGVSKKQKKRQKRVLTTVEGVKPEQRKDAKLSRVIINEKRIKKVKMTSSSKTSSCWLTNRYFSCAEQQVSRKPTPSYVRDEATVREVSPHPHWSRVVYKGIFQRSHQASRSSQAGRHQADGEAHGLVALRLLVSCWHGIMYIDYCHLVAFADILLMTIRSFTVSEIVGM